MSDRVSTFGRSPEALFRAVGPEVLLARVGRDEVDVLNDSAAAMWNLLEVPRSLRALLDLIADAYGVPPEDIERDVRSLVDELTRRGWVRMAGEGDE